MAKILGSAQAPAGLPLGLWGLNYSSEKRFSRAIQCTRARRVKKHPVRSHLYLFAQRVQQRVFARKNGWAAAAMADHFELVLDVMLPVCLLAAVVR